MLSMLVYKFLPDQLFDPMLLKRLGVTHYLPIVPERYLARGFNVLKIVWLYATMDEYEKELNSHGIKIGGDIGDNMICFEHPDDPDELMDVANRRPSPAFILTNTESVETWNATKAKSGWQTAFYKHMRRRMNIMMEGGKPSGGKWTFDTDNRGWYDGRVDLPTYKVSKDEPAKKRAWARVLREDPDKTRWVWGDNPHLSFPIRRDACIALWKSFIRDKIKMFGEYQDAIVTTDSTMFHSLVAPAMNIGLLDVDYIVQTVANLKETVLPISSREGFLRQVIGWREFVRAGYVAERDRWHKHNFFQARGKIDDKLSEIMEFPPVGDAIRDAWNTGYLHHIRRLMVVCNAMVLAEIHPRHIHDWFLAFSIDAFPWVMSVNVYAMGTFASGGEHTTKPYITSSNYIVNMIRDSSGKRVYRRTEPWAIRWDSMWREFIEKHRERLRKAAPRMWLKN